MSRTSPSLMARVASLFMRARLKRALLNEGEIVTFGRKVFGHSMFVPTSLMPGLAARAGEVGGVPGEWIEPEAPHGGADLPTLLYAHGGGYFACSPKSHRPITMWLARTIPARVFTPDYRLAPEHRFPAAFDDLLAVYRGLLKSGVSSARLLVAGDSAGGGLALATCAALRDRGERLPAALALFSPWTDLAMTGESIKRNSESDAMFNCDFLAPASRIYLGGADATHPHASPFYADMTGLPPILAQVSTDEMLYDDAARVIEKAKAAGVAARLDAWSAMPHAWQMLVATVPESREALDDAAQFLRGAVQVARREAA
jgi:acetyl esterase/lipase